MSKELNVMFNGTTEGTTEIKNHYLPKSNELTAMAANIATAIIQQLNDTIENEETKELFENSKISGIALDEIVLTSTFFQEADFSWLAEIDEEYLIGLMKSNQSKRSRLKTKVMTLVNYRSMLTAAVAEHALRTVMGKQKLTRARSLGCATFSEEQLEKLTVDQESLRREIRNQQSKISIVKRKIGDGFEEDQRYIELKAGLEQLMAIRIKPERVDGSWKKERSAVLDQLILKMNDDKLKKNELMELAKIARTIGGFANEYDFRELLEHHPQLTCLETEENNEIVAEA